jgi:hypothetical protein
VKRDLIKRALFPFFRFCQPEDFSFGILHSALSANEFLAANFDQLFHELHSCGVKPICPRSLAESWPESLNLPCAKRQHYCPCDIRGRCSATHSNPGKSVHKLPTSRNPALLDSRRHLPQHFACCT